MKKSITLAILLLCSLSSFTSTAQVFGARAGIGISNLATPSTEANIFGRVTSIELGGTVEFDLADNIYLQSGLSFHKKGGATASSGNFNLSYVEIPVTVRFKFFEIGSEGSLYARAGLYTGMLLSANINGQGLSIGGDANDGFTFLDIGWISELGYSINESFDVGLVVKTGLSNIEPNPSFLKLNNVAIMLSANYRFDF